MRVKVAGLTLVAILLLSFTVILARAQPSQPHNADAMWVEPAASNFNTNTTSVDFKFNVTVAMNFTEDVFAWQAVIYYNATQLNCTRVGATAPPTSEYMSGHSTTFSKAISPGSYPPVGDLKSVLVAETCSAPDFAAGPQSGTLFWAEFQIMLAPSSGNFNSKFDISTEYAATNTYVWDPLGNPYTFTPYDGTYQFTGPSGPPPPPSLSVSISPLSSTIHLGQTVHFTSTVTGGVAPYTFQWFLNGTPASGATSNNWDYTPAAIENDSVYLAATDNNGTSVNSNIVSVTVVLPLSVSISPINPAPIAVNQTLLFTSNVTGGIGPYTFQWFLNNTAVSGATSNSWTFSSTTNNTYAVYLNVTDSLGTSVDSNIVSVTVVLPLSVSISPINPAPIAVNQTLLFTSNVTGGIGPYTFQWFLNNTAVSGATSNSWTFSSMINATYAVYLNVTDQNGTIAESNTAVVTVTTQTPPPPSGVLAEVDIEPQTLNLKSHGKWITCHIELPGGYDVADVNVSTVRLNGTIPAEPKPVAIGDHGKGGIPDLMVKFDRSAVSELILSEGLMTGNVTLTVTGNLRDGTPFHGSVVIRVRMPGDVNADGKVDGRDIALAAMAFGSCPGNPRWNGLVDENEDNKIDGKDIVPIAINFGKAYP